MCLCASFPDMGHLLSGVLFPTWEMVMLIPTAQDCWEIKEMEGSEAARRPSPRVCMCVCQSKALMYLGDQRAPMLHLWDPRGNETRHCSSVPWRGAVAARAGDMSQGT